MFGLSNHVKFGCHKLPPCTLQGYFKTSFCSNLITFCYLVSSLNKDDSCQRIVHKRLEKMHASLPANCPSARSCAIVIVTLQRRQAMENEHRRYVTLWYTKDRIQMVLTLSSQSISRHFLSIIESTNLSILKTN